MIDIYAPIILYVGMAEIKLYSTIDEIKKLISLKKTDKVVLNNTWIRYDIDNKIELFFHKINRKLFRITTLENYKGKLFNKIAVGTNASVLLQQEFSFWYDEFEEVYESDKGVFIETDAQSNTVKWISVYIKELEDDDFENAEW